ncbi:hypothetical protein HYDPIDRAFT_170917 [Hydnomerulius pinastri MD-312]|uniref:Uncharacterized protein n=1 Tax=Hydnomerulius pinastri MD-312 TaxID=994086 RepID=A0A0C9W0A6_9AGAM|nr:hypothetical protein HYDPIDRAFT_170917 [Hydnomerulius pinastri MD-312]
MEEGEGEGADESMGQGKVLEKRAEGNRVVSSSRKRKVDEKGNASPERPPTKKSTPPFTSSLNHSPLTSHVSGFLPNWQKEQLRRATIEVNFNTGGPSLSQWPSAAKSNSQPSNFSFHAYGGLADTGEHEHNRPDTPVNPTATCLTPTSPLVNGEGEDLEMGEGEDLEVGEGEGKEMSEGEGKKMGKMSEEDDVPNDDHTKNRAPKNRLDESRVGARRGGCSCGEDNDEPKNHALKKGLGGGRVGAQEHGRSSSEDDNNDDEQNAYKPENNCADETSEGSSDWLDDRIMKLFGPPAHKPSRLGGRRASPLPKVRPNAFKKVPGRQPKPVIEISAPCSFALTQKTKPKLPGTLHSKSGLSVDNHTRSRPSTHGQGPRSVRTNQNIDDDGDMDENEEDDEDEAPRGSRKRKKAKKFINKDLPGFPGIMPQFHDRLLPRWYHYIKTLGFLHLDPTHCCPQ